MTATVALGDSLHGDVLRPGEPGYDAACSGFNLADRHTPEMVVLAAGTADVAAAVRHASSEGLTVRVQATGHGMGTPARDGMLISTERMQRLSVDPARCTARVAAGVRWQAVIDAAAPHSLAPLVGSAPGVGVVGYTLGGGMGPMARTFGFAADHVRRIELVTATGETLQVTAADEPELFWALRGGKCEIGIVTEIEFDLMPVSSYYGGAIFYAGADAPELLHLFRQWAPALPESTTASIALLRLPDLPFVPEPLRGRLTVHLRFVHIGDAATGAELLAPMRAAATPLLDTAALTPYAQIGSVHQDPTEPMPARDDSSLLRELPAAAVDAMLATAGPGVDTPLIIVELRCLGGALARQPEVPTAVGGRDAAFSVVTIGPYPPPLRPAVDAATDAVLAAVAPWSTGGRQINLQGSATAPEQVRRAWPEATVIRLQQVKRTWDPEHRFRFGYSLEQVIG